MLVIRIVQFLIGAALAGGGGYLAWVERARAHLLFPPDPAGAPWLLIAGVAGVTTGLVFLTSALAPRPNRASRVAADTANRREAVKAADAFYAERDRAVDRDWRSGDLPSAPEPARKPDPLLDLPPRADPPRTAASAPAPTASPKPAPSMADNASAMQPRPAALKPVATSVPPAPTESPFPSAATLAPIPRSSDPPPALAPAPVAALQPAPVAPMPEFAPPAVVEETALFADIRAAIAGGRLKDADKLLAVEREKAQGEALAVLTGLAGDHAAAAGRTSNAKWLWRLALKRFGELNATDSPAAREISERLRLADD